MTIELLLTILSSTVLAATISSLTTLIITRKNRKFENNKELRKVHLFRYEGIHKGYEELIDIKDSNSTFLKNKDNKKSSTFNKYFEDMKNTHSKLVKSYEKIFSLMDADIRMDCDKLIDKEKNIDDKLSELSYNPNSDIDEMRELLLNMISIRNEAYKIIKAKVRVQLSKLIDQISNI